MLLYMQFFSTFQKNKLPKTIIAGILEIKIRNLKKTTFFNSLNITNQEIDDFYTTSKAIK